MRPGSPSGDDVTPFQMGCSGSNHPTSHRYSVHWTGDIFSEDLIGSVSDTIMGGIEGFKPYVHPDCTAHHNYDEPEVYIRWIQFCSLSNVFRVHSDPFNDRRPWSFGNATGNATHDPTESIFRVFSHMRLKLLPMLTSAAVKAADDGTPLIQRLDFVYPTEKDALRQDQYLLLDSMLVAPINPFVNGTKPWIDGQTGKDPKEPGSFNRTRDVWIPPGEWEDAYSGATVTGPKIMSRTAVPLAETVLYHKRPALAVTAWKIGRNAATTDVSDLVIEGFPSSAQAFGAESVTTTRELLAAGSGGAVLTMTEHAPGSDLAVSHCGGGSASLQRLLTVVINESADASASRQWLLRVHLSAREQFIRIAEDSDESATLAQKLAPLGPGEPQVAPVGGEGARPSSKAGEVVELTVAAQRVVQLCVGTH